MQGYKLGKYSLLHRR